ncbi:hypothetical protein [Bifidobacterium animalis]|uniref:hypothetical protein n=1 Tax=Bifidobacterium animalis TaxID=28025 RepID=UPI001917304C|nr:hypothetical protein [Bifidobacterium animalis]QQQ89800.1 hypothetical protein I5Q88_05515 [Bifidobacterium animalis]
MPKGELRIGANPNANGGRIREDLKLPELDQYEITGVKEYGHGRVAHRRNHTSPKARGTHVPRAFAYPKQPPHGQAGAVPRPGRTIPTARTATREEHITPRDFHPMNTTPNQKNNIS